MFAMASSLKDLLNLHLRLASEAGAQSVWRPPVDVYRGPRSWLLKFELAGVRLDDIQLSRQGHYLTVSGLRRDWTIQEDQQSYSMEISYNRFERTIELPCDLEPAEVATEYRDGMLLVRILLEQNQ